MGGAKKENKENAAKAPSAVVVEQKKESQAVAETEVKKEDKVDELSKAVENLELKE